jgi:hypothetical protein
VEQLFEQAIQRTPLGLRAKSIDGYRELSYDRTADQRQGQCVVHTEDGDSVVKYTVQWTNRDEGRFGVRIMTADLPEGTSQ